jgi:hypothetical protein
MDPKGRKRFVWMAGLQKGEHRPDLQSVLDNHPQITLFSIPCASVTSKYDPASFVS